MERKNTHKIRFNTTFLRFLKKETNDTFGIRPNSQENYSKLQSGMHPDKNFLKIH